MARVGGHGMLEALASATPSGDPKEGRQQRTVPPLDPPEGTQPCRHLHFSLEDSLLDF